jgi:hypothetical protein
MERYLLEVQNLSYDFIGLLAEAFGLPADALSPFYDRDELMQHRGKIVQYPQTESGAESQGVGPHYDAGFLTFVRVRCLPISFYLLTCHPSYSRPPTTRACRSRTSPATGSTSRLSPGLSSSTSGVVRPATSN